MSLFSLVTEPASAGSASFSGFGRLIGGYLLEDSIRYGEFEDHLDFDASLVGLQGEYQFNDKLNMTAQVIGTTRERRESGLEWLYVSFKPLHNLNMKLGKMRTPFFAYSDVLDVGFAYPWVAPPEEVYINFVFNTFDGVDVRYDFSINEISAGLEVYYGQNNDDVAVDDFKASSDVDDLLGAIFEFNFSQFRIRSTYHRANVDVKLNQIDEFSSILRQQGFRGSAESISSKTPIDYYQFSVNYDSLNYFGRAEFVFFDTHTGYYQDMRGYYLTGGMYLDSYTFHLTISQRKDSFNSTVSGEIPVGLNASLDSLANSYDTLLSTRVKESIVSLTLGARWDATPNVALKAEVKRTHIGKGNTSTFTSTQPGAFDRTAHLFLFSVETVF